MPATSSITTLDGSFPQTDSTADDDQTPAKVMITVSRMDGHNGGKAPFQVKYQHKPQSAAAILPPP